MRVRSDTIDWSPGMAVRASHAPLAYRLKSWPGPTERSMAVMSKPQLPNWGLPLASASADLPPALPISAAVRRSWRRDMFTMGQISKPTLSGWVGYEACFWASGTSKLGHRSERLLFLVRKKPQLPCCGHVQQWLTVTLI